MTAGDSLLHVSLCFVQNTAIPLATIASTTLQKTSVKATLFEHSGEALKLPTQMISIKRQVVLYVTTFTNTFITSETERQNSL